MVLGEGNSKLDHDDTTSGVYFWDQQVNITITKGIRINDIKIKSVLLLFLWLRWPV